MKEYQETYIACFVHCCGPLVHEQLAGSSFFGSTDAKKSNSQCHPGFRRPHLFFISKLQMKWPVYDGSMKQAQPKISYWEKPEILLVIE
jgi:hypothetical protein